MAGTGTIKTEDINEMVEICANLTRQDIGYEVHKNNNTWYIEMTGAY